MSLYKALCLFPGSIPSLAVYIKKKELVEKSAAEQSAQQLWLYTNSLKW